MNDSRRTSLRDIAQAAAVGRTTVSLALRNDPRLPPATCQRIQAIAKRMGYVPNPLISSVMARHRGIEGANQLGTLGFLTAHPTREGWRNTTSERNYDGAAARAKQLGYNLEIFWLKEPGMTSRRMTAVLRTRNVQGVIIAPLLRAVGHVSLGWVHFAAAAIGYSMRQPRLHRAVHHHFDTMTATLRNLKQRAYRRIGLALTEGFDERVSNLWRAGFLVHQDRNRKSAHIPILLMKRMNKQEFTDWFDRYRPKVIVGGDPVIVEWLRDLGLAVPRDVGFAHLDWSKQLGPITGIDQNSELVGAAAVDLVVNQLHRCELGVPAHPKVVLIGGSWVEGDTISDVKEANSVMCQRALKIH